MTLEADGIIDVWEIETGKVVAQYEGLEVHEDMQSIPDMKQRIAELEQTVARLRDERLREYNVPVTLLRYIVNSHPSLSVDDRITARRWLDSLDGAA